MSEEPPERKRPRQMNNAERIFKTPISFSPRLVGDKARPSPSKFELWREELGLNDCPEPEFDEDDQEKENTNHQPGSECTLVEFRALQKELDMRNSQREELVLKVKGLSDKNKHFMKKLESDEKHKKQQLKILQKTHEKVVADKGLLISNLESIISEQERRIQELETSSASQPNDITKPKKEPLRFHLLVRQIEDLQERLATQQKENLECLAKAENAEDSKKEMEAQVKEQESNISSLQDEVSKLRLIVSNSSTDDQKLVNKLETENAALCSSYEKCKAQLQDEEAARERLKIKTTELEDALGAVQKENERLRTELKDGCDSQQTGMDELKNRNEQLSTANWELQSRLTAVLTKSPEVVTKIKKIEVESESLKEKYDALETEKTQLLQKCTTYQTQVETLQTNLSTMQRHTDSLETQNCKLQQDLTSLDQQNQALKLEMEALKTKTEQMQKDYTALQKQSTDYEQTISDLQVDSDLSEQANTKLHKEFDAQAAQFKNTIKQYKNELQLLQEKYTQEVETLKLERDKLQEELQEQSRSHKAEVEQLKDTVSQYSQELSQEQSRAAAMQEAFDDRLQRLHVVVEHIPLLCTQLISLKEQHSELQDLVFSLPRLVKTQVAQVAAKTVAALEDTEKRSAELLTKYRCEMARRKAYHNQLVELKGNIRVFCRVRPCISEDGGGSQAHEVVECDAADDGLLYVSSKGRTQTYEVDRVFGPQSSQEEVFDEVQSLVTCCVDGYNGCIFAYGQTGSGKTFTMEGTPESLGINQRALSLLFEETQSRSLGYKFNISVSMLEIYNESIGDLLQNQSPTLEVRMAPEGGLCVPGLTEINVTSAEDIQKIFTTGHKNRATACTNLNEHSSRSHALLCIKIVGTNPETQAQTIGRLNLVDLAGSERVSKSGADGARLKEAQNINKSLSCLGDVVHALKNKQNHVPYRNSKLTYLLQESLGGNSKTLMMVQVAPIERHVNETLASLSFAQRIRAVELGAARRVETDKADLRERFNQVEERGSPSSSHLRTPSRMGRKK